MNHHESMFEMDRRIKELEHAMSANDEYLQKVEALNAELLEALKHARLLVSQPTPLSVEIDELIAKAEVKAFINKAEGLGFSNPDAPFNWREL